MQAPVHRYWWIGSVLTGTAAVLLLKQRQDPNEKSANERLLLFKFDDGSVYDGRWRDAKFWGFGTYMTENGDKYEGSFVNGVKDGVGTMRLNNGEIYEGKWKNNKRHGKGMRTGLLLVSVAESRAAQSQYQPAMRNVAGTVVYAGKTLATKFTGMFENDQMHGPGKMFFSTGDRMSARWDHGKATFPMSMVYERGERYIGQFRIHSTTGAYLREGFGISTYSSNDRYYGSWDNDVRSGNGFQITTCGTEYFGKWEGNLMSGKGINTLCVRVREREREQERAREREKSLSVSVNVNVYLTYYTVKALCALLAIRIGHSMARCRATGRLACACKSRALSNGSDYQHDAIQHKPRKTQFACRRFEATSGSISERHWSRAMQVAPLDHEARLEVALIAMRSRTRRC
jgi:hypothetical protein